MKVSWRREFPISNVDKGGWVLEVSAGDGYASRVFPVSEVDEHGKELLKSKHLPDLVLLIGALK
jgi:hypothetical protein